MLLPIFALTLISDQQCAQGFNIRSLRRTNAPAFGSVVARQRSRVWQSVKGDSKLFSAVGKTAETAYAPNTVSAIEKLLERQKTEVRETEALLRKLTSQANNSTNAGLSSEDDRTLSKASEVASSIFSGIDYGFVSRSEGAKADNVVEAYAGKAFEKYGPPANILSLGTQQFKRNLDAIRGEYKDEADVELTPKQQELHKKLKQLTLNSTAIWERERARGPINAPLIIKVPYIVLCWLLDEVFEGRYVFSRFFLLETVARMPYFSYITMLHLYETLGFWRRSSDIKRIHFAEEWNEYHHLLVMESLGGDQAWWVRFMAQHSALVYYTVLTVLWAISPTLSYKFSELLETHAVDTYGQFIDENEEFLKELPPSLAAVEYYSLGASDPLFGEYQTTAIATGGEIRQPGIGMKSLYDVFKAIRADEGDHVSTMKACLDPNTAVRSSSIEKRVLTGIALAAAFGYVLSTGDVIDLTDYAEMAGDVKDLADYADMAGTVVEGGDKNMIDTVIGGIIGGAATAAKEVGSAVEEEGIEPELFEAGALDAITTEIMAVLSGILRFLAGLLQM